MTLWSDRSGGDGARSVFPNPYDFLQKAGIAPSA